MLISLSQRSQRRWASLDREAKAAPAKRGNTVRNDLLEKGKIRTGKLSGAGHAVVALVHPRLVNSSKRCLEKLVHLINTN
jgi:hypothetical protein